jgi:4-hydroxybenzoyl-CoA thioesterase
MTHPRSGSAAPPRGGRVGRKTVPADCFSPTSAGGVRAAGDASGPAEPAPRRPRDAVRLPFERPLLIRFSHCDPAGIVFFPQYLVMINHLVEDWVGEALGVPYAELLGARRTGLPTVSLQCEFTAISRMGETVMLGLSLQRLGSKSITLQLGCRRGDEQRFLMQQVLVFTDLDTHRAIDIPADLRAAMQAFQATQGA